MGAAESMPAVADPVHDGTRVVVLSDLHGCWEQTLLKVPAGDVLLVAGDIELRDERSAAAFNRWLAGLPHAHKVVVSGNMDRWLEEASHEQIGRVLTAATYLQDQVAEVAGLKVLGSPHTPRFYGAFQLEDEAAARAHWATVLPPHTDVDILVTHGPPHGYADTARGKHVGDRALLSAVQQLVKPPKLWVVGHIHEGRGVYHVPHPAGDILLVNAAVAYLSHKQPDKQPVQCLVTAQGATATAPDAEERATRANDGQATWFAPVPLVL